MSPDVVQVASHVLTLAGLLATLTFVALYARRRWWTSPPGRHMMTQSLVLFGIFLLMELTRTVVNLPDGVWLAAFAALDAVLWGQVVLLRWAWRKDPDNQEGET